MTEFYSQLDKKMFSCNPISVAELMANTDDYWYCPFAYCYSNYSREGYAKNILQYANLVEYGGKKLRTTIGGTGIAVSAFCKNQDWALKFAEEIVSEKIQSTFYVQHGGQPGHKTAWLNEDANLLCNDFFRNVLPVMENGFMRPRYNGYLHFQDHAGGPLHKYLLHGGSPEKVLDEINRIYQLSIQPHLSKTIA
jgi:multiple sugar transport system substrate-binding protein